VNGIQLALRTLHQGEQHLAKKLVTVADRHRDEHEVHHVAGDIAVGSREHVKRLAEAAVAHGLELYGPFDGSSSDELAVPQHNAAELVGHQPEPGLLLLRDLHDSISPRHTTRCTGRCSPRSPRSRRPPEPPTCSPSHRPATPRPCARCAGPTP